MGRSTLPVDAAGEHFERLIFEFDELDRRSFRFRYPEDREGHSSHDLEENGLPDIVDVQHMYRCLRAMFNYIDGSCDYFEIAAQHGP